MTDVQPPTFPPRPHDVDGLHVTMAAPAGGPLPSGVDLDSLLSHDNATLLTNEEIQRLILESPFLLRPASNNFDTATQVRYSHALQVGSAQIVSELTVELYTWGDSDVILFHIYARRFPPSSCR